MRIGLRATARMSIRVRVRVRIGVKVRYRVEADCEHDYLLQLGFGFGFGLCEETLLPTPSRTLVLYAKRVLRLLREAAEERCKRLAQSIHESEVIGNA